MHDPQASLREICPSSRNLAGLYKFGACQQPSFENADNRRLSGISHCSVDVYNSD